eukprot:CAMPEP_0195506880 /NCGR_PEP_ID=MMETSP0794_2-20130614/425_1 /TAXON_ID=515487 /ORGANISM="Stephanopyxis turris, Strain CCMP 815" /LENGTH=882 /DNA_ID=CAMNT_0040633345 /DNA_START=220 /DNA_END=2868 /DNA_ORIENTATION=-
MAFFLATVSRMRPAGAAAAAAFIPSTNTVGRSLTTKVFTSAAVTTRRSRRARPRQHSGSLMNLMEQNVRRVKMGMEPIMSLQLSATETTEGEKVDEEMVEVKFPLQGVKDVLSVPPRMRFAPSPTGSLHVGGARTALYNWLVAKKGQLDTPNEGAAFIVRVEDTDLARSTKESEKSVLDDLKWLGLIWDEGPEKGGEFGPYRQSERNLLYQSVAQKLVSEGKAYPCFCTQEDLDAMREKQEAEGIPPRYDNTWRDASDEDVAAKMAEGAPYTVRFKVPSGARVVIDDAVRGTVAWDAEATVGDFILLRSTGVPVYNFCVAVDDASMGITTVIRAEEHLTNTLRQGLILDAVGAPRPRYAHCSLILGEDKQKLSKRHGATSCNQFRLDGFLPDAMINYLSLLGWNEGGEEEIYTREELIDAFDVDRIVKSPSVFDMDKLRWVNSQHLKMYAIEEITPLVEEQFHFAGLLDASSSSKEDFVLASTTIAKQMMETTQDAVINARAVLGYSLPASFDDLKVKDAKEMIQQGNFYRIGKRLVDAFQNNELPLPDETNFLAAFQDSDGKPIVEDNELGGSAYNYPQAYKAFMKTIAKDLGAKGKFLFHPVRLALTGEMSGQDVTKQLSLLAMASQIDNSPIAEEKKADVVVTLEERISQLSKFLDTIPVEFQTPPEKKKEKKAQKGGEKKGEAASKKDSSDIEYDTKVTIDQRATYDGPPISALDIRVGEIKRVWEHEEADKLYCEEIDVGEDEPRLIASGLRPFIPDKSTMENRKVLVLCNLKARKMVGFPSHGMVLCAGNEDHTEVKFVSPPPDAKIGERVTVPGWNFEGEEGAPYAENKVGKKKIFEKIAPFLKTSEYGVPEFLGCPLMTSAGVCTSPLPGAQVS